MAWGDRAARCARSGPAETPPSPAGYAVIIQIASKLIQDFQVDFEKGWALGKAQAAFRGSQAASRKMLPIKRVVVCGGVDEPPLTPRRRVGANQESRRTGCEAPREGYLTQTVQ